MHCFDYQLLSSSEFLELRGFALVQRQDYEHQQHSHRDLNADQHNDHGEDSLPPGFLYIWDLMSQPLLMQGTCAGCRNQSSELLEDVYNNKDGNEHINQQHRR